MTDQELMAAVATELLKHGLNAEPWHSGGGIFCVDVKFPSGGYLVWGTANEDWGADVYGVDDELIGSLSIWVKSDADAITAANRIAEVCLALGGKL